MGSQLDVKVFKDSDLSELKPRLELKKEQMTKQRQEKRSNEIKQGIGVHTEVSNKGSNYFPYSTDNLEIAFFVKKEFKFDKDLQFSQNLYISEGKCLEVDVTGFKQKSLQNDNDPESSQFCNCEIKRRENLNDKQLNEVQLNIEYMEKECLCLSNKHLVQLKDKYFLCELCNELPKKILKIIALNIWMDWKMRM